MVSTVKVKSTKPPPAMIRWVKLNNGQTDIQIINASKRYSNEEIGLIGTKLFEQIKNGDAKESGNIPVQKFLEQIKNGK